MRKSRPQPWSWAAMALVLGSVVLAGCSLLQQQPRFMGVEINRNPAAYHDAQPFASRTAVLAKMQPGCYFCSPTATYLRQCTLIRSTTRAQAKLMHLADLTTHLPGGTLPPSWQGTTPPDTLVWVAAVSGDVTFAGANPGRWAGDRAWAVFVLPHDPGLAPQEADAGPMLPEAGSSTWPAYYDALPDFAAS